MEDLGCWSKNIEYLINPLHKNIYALNQFAFLLNHKVHLVVYNKKLCFYFENVKSFSNGTIKAYFVMKYNVGRFHLFFEMLNFALFRTNQTVSCEA